MKKLITTLTALSVFFVLVACGGTETPTAIPPTQVPPTSAPTAESIPPTVTAAPQASDVCGKGNTPAYLTQVVLAEDTKGDNFEPVNPTDRFEPGQATFHAVASVKNAPKGVKLGARWYVIQATGYKPNFKINESEMTFAEGGTRKIDFKLKNPADKWPAGSYCVEIYAEGNLALSREFQVIGDSTPSNADIDIVKQVVLAENTKPSSFEPINPTTKFRSNTPLIHAAVRVEKAPANTQFRARWYAPGQDPLDFMLQTDGTRWLDFRLMPTPPNTPAPGETPAPEGFPAGEYKVEIYVNEQLANTQTFTVQ